MVKYRVKAISIIIDAIAVRCSTPCNVIYFYCSILLVAGGGHDGSLHGRRPCYIANSKGVLYGTSFGIFNRYYITTRINIPERRRSNEWLVIKGKKIRIAT